MSSYSINEIMKMLPHRSPFLLIDRVIECEAGKRAVAIKNVTIDEPYCRNQCPDNSSYVLCILYGKYRG